MTSAAAIVLIIAFGLDLLVREWPRQLHPVAWFGSVVAPIDRDWHRPRLVGVCAAICLPLAAAVVVMVTVHVGATVSGFLGVLLAALVLFSTFSLRMLLEVAREVDRAAASSLPAARDAVRALVGRDVSTMEATGLRSATIESVAENLADGFVAPLLAFVLGAQFSVTLGVGCAAWVKAVNTMDSMLGYHHVPTGWASARLDDLVMAIPARLTACLIALVALRPWLILNVRSAARRPASPNAGWPMATMAVTLGVRLEKPNQYVINADCDVPTASSVDRAVRTTGIGGIFAVCVAGVLVW